MKRLLYFAIMLLLISTLSACGSVKDVLHIKDSKNTVVKKAEVKKDPVAQESANADEVKEETQPQKPAPPPPLPDKVLLDAPLISQLPELPNGCEITSLTMLLQQAGIKADKMTLAKQMIKVPFNENGVHGDPNDGFVGNMYHGGPGFAVYHGPVANLAKQYLGSKVVDLTGEDWKAIEKELADHHAVWVIVNSAFKWLPPDYFQSWHTKNGDMEVTMHEHSVLVTGYDSEKIYFNDPLTNTKNKSVNKEDFIDAWKQMGSQAISYH